MLPRLRVILTKIFSPSPTPSSHLGRWSLKHDPKVCENYLRNLYADPGYPNTMKPKWIVTLKTTPISTSTPSSTTSTTA